MHTILSKDDIQINDTAYRFQGGDYGGVAASFFWVFTPPGRGSGLHRHPYDEVFVLQQGQATFRVGDATIEAQGGTILIAPAQTPHKYTNSGDVPLQMLSIHPSSQVIQEWLEE